MNSKPKNAFWELLAVAFLAVEILLFPAPARAASDASGSNASNMGGDASFQVNPRTGGVSLEGELFSIHGINEDVDLAFSLTYQSEDAISDEETYDQSVFGLPYGWSMNVSYIENKSTYVSVNVDGSQEYVYDSAWRTLYTPAGSNEPQILLTGLKEYNRTDTNLQRDQSGVEVNGIASEYKMTAANGVTQYFSGGGLLLKKVDRFGNGIDYYSNYDTDPQMARIAKIVDSWGNDIVFSYCTDGAFVTGAEHTNPGKLQKLLQVFKQCTRNPSHPLCRTADVSETCSQGDVRIDLPDGRSVGWGFEQGNEIRELIDAQGKSTVLNYSSECADNYEVLSAVTSPAGASASILYQCMNLCTRKTYPENCTSDTKQWPVAWIKYDCPSNPSGKSCPQGSAADNLTTRFLIGGTQASNELKNYTGYPYYSPYDAPDPAADALMQSNDNDFEYVTTAQTLDANGFPVLASESHYNFLHLEKEIIHYAKDAQGNWPAVAKQTSNCFDLTGEGPSYGCPMTQVPDYNELLGQYQSPVITGTCVYALGGQPGSGARLSIVGKSYDSFGNLINRKAYHGTSATGIVSDCSQRFTRMDPSPLNLVLDSYLQYDTPSDIQNNFLVMGQGAKHYGLLAGALTFLYEDPDDGGAASSATPVSVTLSCNSFTTDSGLETAGTAVKTNLFGALPTTTSAPSVLGVVDACTSPNWDQSVAPPKKTTYTHDGAGRVVSVLGQWAGTEQQRGIESTQTSFTYALSNGVSGESPCADGKVLQKTTTDAHGNQSVSRVCTQNSFFLSSADEEGRTVTYSHDPVGLATRITQPNGSYQQHDYYYACPLAQDGFTPTCPDGNTANGACPYGDPGLARSCTVATQVAGAGNVSYMDGVKNIVVKDGSGRTIQTLDNLGPGSSGAGYDQLQTRSRSTYDDRGLLVAKSSSIGVSSPLVYTTTSSYGPKLRPTLACGPRGDSHQLIHDDLGQHVKRTMNGHQLNRMSMNDSRKLTEIQDCPVVETQSLSAGTNCPTVTTATQNAACSGNIYLTEIMRDGAGNQRGITASDPAADGSNGASIGSVSAAVTYSAELHKHGFSVQGTAVGSGQSASATAAWERDLNGLGLGNSLSVTAGTGPTTTSFSSSTFAFDALRNHTGETNLLGGGLATSNTFTPTRKLSTHTDYAGTQFHSYYDDMDWLVRHCYPAAGSGSEGEITTHDPITGEILSISHFTNPGACSACSDGDCGDVIDNRIDYAYNAFGGIELKTYSEDLDTNPLRD
jgi:hypothetical protein